MSDRAHVISPGEAPSRPLSEIVRDVLQDVSHIVQAEIRLARTELEAKADKAKKASGVIGAAAIAGFFALASLVTACIAALALAMSLWLAALIIAVILGIAAAVAFSAGRSRLRRIDP